MNGDAARGVRLHHLAFGARDVEGVAAFYRVHFGLREADRHWEPDGRLRSIWLDLGGPVLMIERTDDPARGARGAGAGLFLLALAFEPQMRDALERSLAESGFPVESRTTHTIYLRDPEGNQVAVSSYPLPSTSK